MVANQVEQCFISLAKRDSAQWVLEGDIRGCFDNISHDWLLKHIPMDKVVLRKWLYAVRWIKTRYFERNGLRDWVFACAHRPPELAFRPMLFRLAGLPIKRHTKVRSEANPFDPAWTAYFHRRANAH